jgi:hypothetical protein
MNDNLNPLTFWQQLKGTIALHDAIFDTRKNIKKLPAEKKTIKNSDKMMNDTEYDIGLKLVLNSTNNFHGLFEKIFVDMDRREFKRTDSVSKQYDTHLIKYNNRYELLSRINLYAHTMNVIVEMIKLAKEFSLPQQIQDITILLALLHDFGKNHSIAAEFQFEKENLGKHHRISANYARHIMYDESLRVDVVQGITRDLIDMVYSTLRMHHEPEKNNNMFLEMLITADQNAREQELHGVLRNLKSKKEKYDS